MHLVLLVVKWYVKAMIEEHQDHEERWRNGSAFKIITVSGVCVCVCVLLVCRSFHKKMLSFVLVISLFELDYITSRGSGYCLLYNVWWCAYKACCCRRRRLFSFNYNQLRMVYWRSNCYVSLSVVIAPPALLFSNFYC